MMEYYNSILERIYEEIVTSNFLAKLNIDK